MAAKKTAAARRTNRATTTPTPDEPPAEERTRIQQLQQADDDGDDDEGPGNMREYFARVNRPMGATMTVEDFCHALEYFGLTELPEGHAEPRRRR
jgi:hypothetical protein